MTCYMENKSFLNATADQHFFDGSNARWVGFLFASNFPLCGAEQGSNARGGGGGGTREFEWNFKRFKEGIKERKLFLEHQQTVAPNPRVHQVGRGLFGCPYINF